MSKKAPAGHSAPSWLEVAVLAGITVLVALALVDVEPAFGGVQPTEPEACAVLAERILAHPETIEVWTDEQDERASRALYQKDDLKFDVRITWDRGRPCFAGARQLRARP